MCDDSPHLLHGLTHLALLRHGQLQSRNSFVSERHGRLPAPHSREKQNKDPNTEG